MPAARSPPVRGRRFRRTPTENVVAVGDFGANAERALSPTPLAPRKVRWPALPARLVLDIRADGIVVNCRGSCRRQTRALVAPPARPSNSSSRTCETKLQIAAPTNAFRRSAVLRGVPISAALIQRGFSFTCPVRYPTRSRPRCRPPSRTDVMLSDMAGHGVRRLVGRE